MKKINFLYIGLVAAGCSGEATTTRQIENQSDQEIVMQLYRSGQNYGDSIVLIPNGSSQISVKTYNQAEEDESNCAYGLDSAYTRVVGGGTMTKNIADNSEWEVQSDKTKELPPEYEHTCVFTVRNSDIVE